MPKYRTRDIRNIALVGHSGSGKTTLADRRFDPDGVHGKTYLGARRRGPDTRIGRGPGTLGQGKPLLRGPGRPRHQGRPDRRAARGRAYG